MRIPGTILPKISNNIGKSSGAKHLSTPKPKAPTNKPTIPGLNNGDIAYTGHVAQRAKERAGKHLPPELFAAVGGIKIKQIDITKNKYHIKEYKDLRPTTNTHKQGELMRTVSWNENNTHQRVIVPLTSTKDGKGYAAKTLIKDGTTHQYPNGQFNADSKYMERNFNPTGIEYNCDLKE